MYSAQLQYPCSGLTYPWGGAPIYNPPVPFTHLIPGGLYQGKMIYISGVPKTNAARFTINLSVGSDHAFHFDVRMRYGSDKPVLVRNTKQNGSWGPEERHVPHYPFNDNQFFEMIIFCDRECYKVAVNNQHFIVYNHRTPPERVDRLTITGDIQVLQLRFQ